MRNQMDTDSPQKGDNRAWGAGVEGDGAIDRHEIESDGDTLEPQEFGTDNGTVNFNDPEELTYWAEQFQISTGELKAAALLRGNSIAEIKKYLSI